MGEPVSTLYLWRQRTLFLGEIGQLKPLSPGAHTLLLGLDAPLALSIEGKQFHARSYLIAAGTEVEAQTEGQRIACCFLDPLGRDWRFHQAHMRQQEGGVATDASNEEALLTALTALCHSAVSGQEAYPRLQGLLFPSEEEAVAEFDADPRIAHVVELIRSDPADNLSNEALAEQVGLSGDRLQRLFKQSTGIPIRRYRLWHRLFVTSTMMAMGSTLTDAALAAGFSDSSHLTHVFKSMLGMSPSYVLRRSRYIRILAGGDES